MNRRSRLLCKNERAKEIYISRSWHAFGMKGWRASSEQLHILLGYDFKMYYCDKVINAFLQSQIEWMFYRFLSVVSARLGCYFLETFLRFFISLQNYYDVRLHFGCTLGEWWSFWLLPHFPPSDSEGDNNADWIFIAEPRGTICFDCYVHSLSCSSPILSQWLHRNVSCT